MSKGDYQNELLPQETWLNVCSGCCEIVRKLVVPVAQWLEHCVSSAKVVGSFTREYTY